MLKQNLLVVGLLATLFAIPVHADEGQVTEGKVSAVDLHIGGGIGVPLDPTGNFAGVGGTFQAGAGPNLGKHHSIVGEFMWHGLPPNRSALLPILNALCLLNPPASPNLPCSVASINATDNVYTLTANYLFRREGKRFGYYVIGGGGWYCRMTASASLNRLYQSTASKIILASHQKHPAVIATTPQNKVKEFEGRTLVGAAPWSLSLARYGMYLERAKSRCSRESV